MFDRNIKICFSYLRTPAIAVVLASTSGCLNLPPQLPESLQTPPAPARSSLTPTTSPSPPPESTIPISELSNYREITISGTVRSVVGNEFTLNDGTGEIIVDPGPRWWQEIDLTPGETVIVTGEYDDDDFDAYRIVRDNGETIEIRDRSGPPPWANRDRLDDDE